MVCAPVRRDNSLAKARGLCLRTGAQTMFYLSLIVISCFISLFGDNPRALARGISPVQADKPRNNYFIALSSV